MKNTILFHKNIFNIFMNYDEAISKIFFENDWKLNRKNYFKFRVRKNRYPNLKNYLENRFLESYSLKEILYRIKHKIEDRPTCKYCGKPVKFIGKGRVMFGNYCSTFCRAKDTSKYNWQEGHKRYNLEHYGVEHNFQIDKCKKKRMETLIKHYGEHPLANKEIQNRIKKTCLERYGVEHTFLSEKCIKNKDKFYKNFAGKVSSKPENKVYELLKEKFDNIERSYKSEKYPFNCDFYLPKLNMYIECHFSHYHRGKAFNKDNKEHIKELENLKIKSIEKHKLDNRPKNQYDMMIYTWTDLDVRKRNIAKENNLNFVELFSLKEAKEFIDKL